MAVKNLSWKFNGNVACRAGTTICLLSLHRIGAYEQSVYLSVDRERKSGELMPGFKIKSEVYPSILTIYIFPPKWEAGNLGSCLFIVITIFSGAYSSYFTPSSPPPPAWLQHDHSFGPSFFSKFVNKEKEYQHFFGEYCQLSLGF